MGAEVGPDHAGHGTGNIVRAVRGPAATDIAADVAAAPREDRRWRRRRIVRSWRSGAQVGGGVEWAFAGNWTAFAEYNYLDFGTSGMNFTPAVGAATFPINIKQNINSFMVGINYRFGAIGY